MHILPTGSAKDAPFWLVHKLGALIYFSEMKDCYFVSGLLIMGVLV